MNGGDIRNFRHPDGSVHRQYQIERQRMQSFWEFPIINAMAKERVDFPTQKRLNLDEQIIRASSKKGDIVLDPFAGCATTCVAAEHLGRQWVGIGIWKKVSEVVINRLEKEG